MVPVEQFCSIRSKFSFPKTCNDNSDDECHEAWGTDLEVAAVTRWLVYKEMSSPTTTAMGVKLQLQESSGNSFCPRQRVFCRKDR